MTNREYFDYLKVTDKLPKIQDMNAYNIVCLSDILIKDYVQVHKKMLSQKDLSSDNYFGTILESNVYLLESINNQSDFDTFVKGLDDIVNSMLNYCHYHKFLDCMNRNYIKIVKELTRDRRLKQKELKIEDLLRALRVIVNPYYVFYSDRLCNCKVVDVNPKAHLDISVSPDTIINNVAVMLYSKGDCELLKIETYGGYKDSLLELRKRLKEGSIDFAVCANDSEYGTLVPLMNVLLTDCQGRC